MTRKRQPQPRSVSSDERDDELASDIEALAPRPTSLSTTEIGRDGVLRALVWPLRLEVVEGADAGATYTSKSERVVVGTHPSADVVLQPAHRRPSIATSRRSGGRTP